VAQRQIRAMTAIAQHSTSIVQPSVYIRYILLVSGGCHAVP